MYKINIKKNGQPISSLQEWSQIGKPMKQSQWKDGRSAKELARYILNGNGYFPKEIEDVLLEIGCTKNKVFECEPEKETALIGVGKGRQHDLLCVQDGEIVIGIEAKVDETFGDLLLDELSKKGITSNKVYRITSLYKNIYGDKSLNISNIRYQLLTGVSGILEEARQHEISKALFLVITLKKDGSYDQNKIDSNKNDFDNFISSISKFNIGNSSVGPYKVNVYTNVNLYVRYIEVKI